MSAAVLDRIEGDVAVLVADGREWHLPAAWLPVDAREGDRLCIALEPDPEGTHAARTRTAEQRARLSRDDDGGDFKL